MTIKEKEIELIEEFDMFEDWMDKYTYLIELGKNLNKNNVSINTPENLVKGCNSQVWLIYELKDGLIYLTADSDALIPKGIAALLVRLYSGHLPQEVFEHEPTFINEIGLVDHLSPNRANGLLSMLIKIKSFSKNIIDNTNNNG